MTSCPASSLYKNHRGEKPIVLSLVLCDLDLDRGITNVQWAKLDKYITYVKTVNKKIRSVNSLNLGSE